MNWTSAVWFVGLVPWGAVVAYLLARERRATRVPHVWLWPTAGGVTRRAMERRVPPVGVILGLAAAAVGIAAAGGLAVGKRMSGGVIVVLDRGVVPSGDGGSRPFRGTVDRTLAMLGGVPARLVCVPRAAGVPSVETADWGSVANGVAPVAVDTGAAVNATVAELLRTPGEGAIVVLTDRTIGVGDPRVVRVAPSEQLGGVGIVQLAVRERPRVQAMVRLVNRSGRPTAVVRVTSAGEAVERAVALPGAGRTVDVFVDLRQLGPTLAASVDDALVDGKAWLSREGEAIEVEATPGVPLAMRRMVDVFNRSMPSSGPRRTVWATDQPLSIDRPGVWVADVGAETDAGAGSTKVTAHPVTDGIGEWAGGGGVVPRGLVPVAMRDGRAVVAVRDGEARQVWAALDVGRMSRSADWVVFLANAFRWVGGDGLRYEAEKPHLLGGGWARVDDGPAPAGVEAGYWPGLYRSADGRTVAVNGTLGANRTVVASDDAVRWLTLSAAGRRSFGGPLSAVAVGCLGVAAAVWPGRGRVPKLT